MFIIFLVFCVVVGWVRVSYLLSFLSCGRMGSVFLILVFCVVVGWGACFLSSYFSVLW
jgi:hypothetical protein